MLILTFLCINVDLPDGEYRDVFNYIGKNS